jgi:hypothetical protein
MNAIGLAVFRKGCWRNIGISLFYREENVFPLAHLCNGPLSTVMP